MTQGNRLQLVLLPGRYITGDHTKKRTLDLDGRPVPPEKQAFNFGVAVRKDHPEMPKLVGDIWNFTAQCYAQNGIVLQRMQRGFAIGSKQGGISWKIKDGDQPNADGTRMEHAAGCYVFFFNSLFPIKCCDNQNREIDPAMIKRGYYVDVAMNIQPNNETGDRAGIYLNPQIIRLLGFGEEIFGGITPDQAFGGRPVPQLPPGASATPVAPAGGMPGLPGMPPMAGQPGFTPPGSPQFTPPMQPQYGVQPSAPPPYPGGSPYPSGPVPGMPGNVPGYAPSAAVPPAPTGYAPTLPPSTVYPSNPPAAWTPAPGQMPGNAPIPGNPYPTPGGAPMNPGSGPGFSPTGYPINPQTGQPVAPHPGFLQPGQPPR